MATNNAKQILKLVGGKSNVQNLVHCATRLRFTLKDEGKANKKALEALPDVLSVVQSGGQYQVVIGPQVADYYDIIMKELGNTNNDHGIKKPEKVSFTKIISGAFTPLIPALAGAGMVKALVTLCVTLHWMSENSALAHVLSAAGNAVFYFLPIFLGITLAKQFKADPFVGGVLGAALLEPNFTQLIGKKGLDIFGIGLQAVDYSTTIFPIFIMMIVYAFLNKGLKKAIPKQLQLFLNPMISLIVLVPLTVIAFGPWGNSLGNAISQCVMWLFKFNGAIAGMVVGAVYPFLVILGLHWGLTPITLQNIHMFGGDVIEGAGGIAQFFATIGVAIGAYLRAQKNSKMRELAGPTIVAGFLAGVTEPIIYGIVLRSKRTMAAVAIGGAAGGLINGLFGVKLTQYVFYNVFSLALSPLKPMFIGLIGIVVAMAVSAVITYFFGMNPGDEIYLATNSNGNVVNTNEIKGNEESKNIEPTIVVSPLEGKVLDLKDVDDEVFSSGSVGKGIAVLPSKGEVRAPFNGKVLTVFPSKHAIGLVSDNGAEFLIHLGLNTVNLKGKYYDAQVKDGDEIKQGQLLMKFDLDQIEKEGYSMQSPVLWTNYKDHKYEITVKAGQEVEFEDQIMTVNE